jgi:hypothetical protein
MSGFDGYPLHRLNTAMMRSWLLFPHLRREMGSWLSKNYKTGCVVLSPELRAFAVVAPNGQLRALPYPYRKFQFWQVSNKPSARYAECACRDFYDPESHGRWGDRDRERMADIHHPHCQGREVAIATWARDFSAADSRVAQGKAPQERPDEWIRTAEALEGKRTVKGDSAR